MEGGADNSPHHRGGEEGLPELIYTQFSQFNILPINVFNA
jgi:hypothetical protein